MLLPFQSLSDSFEEICFLAGTRPGILTERYSLNPAWAEQVADATRQAVKCRQQARRAA